MLSNLYVKQFITMKIKYKREEIWHTKKIELCNSTLERTRSLKHSYFGLYRRGGGLGGNRSDATRSLIKARNAAVTSLTVRQITNMEITADCARCHTMAQVPRPTHSCTKQSTRAFVEYWPNRRWRYSGCIRHETNQSVTWWAAVSWQKASS